MGGSWTCLIVVVGATDTFRSGTEVAGAVVGVVGPESWGEEPISFLGTVFLLIEVEAARESPRFGRSTKGMSADDIAGGLKEGDP